MMQDTLDRVLLSEDADHRWRAFARTQAVQAIVRKYFAAASEIPDEMAREEVDGSLTIFLPLPNQDHSISMRVEKGEWTWMSNSLRNH